MPKKNGIAAASGADVLIDRRDIEVITAEIQFYKNQAGEAILEIGRRLNEAKEQLQHGEWLDWLRDKVDFSEGSAQRFMRIAREYSNPSPVTDLGIAKAVTLLALPAAERDEFMAEIHEVNGQTKTVDEMSKRELEQAVRERKEALEAKEAAERQADEQRRAAQEALERAAEAAADAKRAKDEKAELERQLEELRSAEPDQQTLDAVRKEATDAAKKEAEEKLKKKIAKADEDKAKAEAAQAEAEQERDRIMQEQAAMSGTIKNLERQLVAASSQTVAIFKTHFESVQMSLNRMLDCIKDADDDDTRDKLSAALRALCEKVLENM